MHPLATSANTESHARLREMESRIRCPEPLEDQSLNFDSKVYEKAARKRLKKNAKILKVKALENLVRWNYNNPKGTFIPPIGSDTHASVERAVNDIVFDVQTAFELLPHSIRFLDLVLDLYNALSSEAEGYGTVVITNERKSNDINKGVK